MTTGVHETPGSWLGELRLVITNWLKAIAICGRPFVLIGGNGKLEFSSGVRLPDQSIYLHYREDDKHQSKDKGEGEGEDMNKDGDEDEGEGEVGEKGSEDEDEDETDDTEGDADADETEREEEDEAEDEEGDGAEDENGGEDENEVEDQGEAQDEDEIPQRFLVPRVVLETAYSQSYEVVKNKAWRYLHESDRGVHAVIIIHMRYPVTLKRNFRADIGVWVRNDTGKTDDDFPLEPCVCRRTSDGHKDPGDNPSSDNESARPGSTVSAESHPTLVYDQTSSSDGSSLASVVDSPGAFRPGPNDPFMILRSGKPVVFYDEKSTRELSNFVRLNAYDFLRSCDERPNVYIQPSHLDLDLRPLKELIATKLVAMRAQLKAKSRATKSKVAKPQAVEVEVAEPVDGRPYPESIAIGKRQADTEIGPPGHRARRDA